jgi:hypothetical protein
MTDRTERGLRDQITRELLALVAADQRTLDSVQVRVMLAEAWYLGYQDGVARSTMDALGAMSESLTSANGSHWTSANPFASDLRKTADN